MCVCVCFFFLLPLPLSLSSCVSHTSTISLYLSSPPPLSHHSTIERVHLFARKRLVNVSPRTPNQLVYEETGRYPLYICSYTTCIKYWLNVLRMQADRLPVKSYKMLHNMHGNNKKTTGPPLLALHCTDRVLDTFGRTRAFVV